LFRHLSAELPFGSLIALVGPSGSGKSTLLALLGGLIRPTEGRVSLPDQCDEPTWVFQSVSVIPCRTALDVVILPLLGAGATRRAASDEGRRILELMGLGAVAHRPSVRCPEERHSAWQSAAQCCTAAP
jgi:putative ABC transport system ATP-binding protein